MSITPGFLGINEPNIIDKRADTNVVTRNAVVVHREVVSLGSADGATPERIAEITAANALKVDPSAVQSPVISTDAAGVNQQAITAAGDAKVTLDGEAISIVALNLSIFHLVVASGTNATVVKNAAGSLRGWYLYNNTASMRKIAFHDSSSTPTAGTAVLFSICMPPNSAANVSFFDAIVFSSGIGITTVTGIADSDSTGVTASDLNINLFYV